MDTAADNHDDAIVGAGILGLAHAYHLARRGRRVLVLERGVRAMGASVRNFGMIWPIGQPAGRLHQLALRSREHWLTVLQAAQLWHSRCGSLHLAYHEDEAAVLVEFARIAVDKGFDVTWLSPERVCDRSSAVKRFGLRGGLWSPTELCVDPREVIAGLPEWLGRRYGVHFEFDVAVTGYDRPRLWAGHRKWRADRLWVCCGADVQLLYPDVLQAAKLRMCKLQMMRSVPCGERVRLGPHLAAGLTLRHYQSFAECPTLPALKARIARQMPEFDRHGIHVMAAQNGKGELILGDSHEYDADIEPFDKTVIDDLVLAYLRSFLDVGDLTIAARWHGIYAKYSQDAFFHAQPAPGAVIVTGVGGMGMTLSFGLAEEMVRTVLGEA
jgi:FAD dependent oxidoreductase TIGR03364